MSDLCSSSPPSLITAPAHGPAPLLQQALPQRKRFAIMARLGEKDVLQLCKKQAALMMMGVFNGEPRGQCTLYVAMVVHFSQAMGCNGHPSELSATTPCRVIPWRRR